MPLCDDVVALTTVIEFLELADPSRRRECFGKLHRLTRIVRGGITEADEEADFGTVQAMLLVRAWRRDRLLRAVQRAWRARLAARAARKEQAAVTIQRAVLHHMYRPEGPLAQRTRAAWGGRVVHGPQKLGTCICSERSPLVVASSPRGSGTGRVLTSAR